MSFTTLGQVQEFDRRFRAFVAQAPAGNTFDLHRAEPVTSAIEEDDDATDAV
jgi:hypothetical protein